MYIRFESTTLRDAASRGFAGIFSAYGVLRDQSEFAEGWQMQQLNEIYDWFNNHLDRPTRLNWRSRRARVAGLCWFRAEATTHIEQARYMAWLITDLGLPIRQRISATPGRLLWHDDHQIVATPVL
jgi:hypothetical protein